MNDNDPSLSSAENNPYAPPAILEDRPQWKREGDFLLVREGSILPPIDLESGSEIDLISINRHFITRSTPYQLANVFIPIIFFVRPDLQILSAAVAIAMWMLPRWHALRLSFIIAESVQFQYFRERPRLRASKRHERVFGLTITAVILVGGSATYLFRETIGAILPMVSMMILSLILYIGTKRKPSRLFMISAPEGWVKIGGVRREVLEHLEQMSESPGSGKQNTRSGKPDRVFVK